MSDALASFHNLHPTADDLAADVLAGLSRPQKAIPPKYFYDAEGSRLFDAITELPEYYPTRIETAMLHEYADEIAKKAGTVGHTLRLHRESLGDFRAEDMVDLATVEQLAAHDLAALKGSLLTPDAALTGLLAVEVGRGDGARFAAGQRVSVTGGDSFRRTTQSRPPSPRRITWVICPSMSMTVPTSGKIL